MHRTPVGGHRHRGHAQIDIYGATYTQSDIHMDNIPEGTYNLSGHTLGTVIHPERHTHGGNVHTEGTYT